MENIKWCLNVKNGIELVAPNTNLSEAYISKAHDALISIDLNKITEWKIATAYYTSYFSVYAILTKIGIKCEIHKCTIEFTKTFLQDYLDHEDTNFLTDSFNARNETQYYVNKNISNEKFEEIIKRTPSFHVKCKEISSKLTEKEIKDIRNKVTSHIL